MRRILQDGQPGLPAFITSDKKNKSEEYTENKIMDKSALKRAYKETRQPMGVYGIRNTRDKIVFIGYDRDVRARINRHKAELQFGSHRNRDLQKMWNSTGESRLSFEVLDILDHEEDRKADPAEELKTLTEMWIHKLEGEGYDVVKV